MRCRLKIESYIYRASKNSKIVYQLGVSYKEKTLATRVYFFLFHKYLFSYVILCAKIPNSRDCSSLNPIAMGNVKIPNPANPERKRKTTSTFNKNQPVKKPKDKVRESPPPSRRHYIPQGSTVDLRENLQTPDSSSFARTSTNSASLFANSLKLIVNSDRRENQDFPKITKVKPIIVDFHYKAIESNLNVLKLSPMPFLKIIRGVSRRPQTKIIGAERKSEEDAQR